MASPYKVRGPAPVSIVLNKWTDSTKTVGGDWAAIGSSWLAELRESGSPTYTEPAATFSIDASAATGSGSTPGKLVLSLTSDQFATLIGGHPTRSYSWDLFETTTDTLVNRDPFTLVLQNAYTHPAGSASPSASTPVGSYDFTDLGDVLGNVATVDVLTGPEGPAGPAGAPGGGATINDAAASTSSVYSSTKVTNTFQTQAQVDARVTAVGNGIYVGKGEGATLATLAPRYVQTLTTGLCPDSPTNLRTGLSTATYADGGFQQEMTIAVTGSKGSATLTSTDTSKVAGLGSGKFAAVLNATDGSNDFFVTVVGNNGSNQITLRSPLAADFTGTLSAKYDNSGGQHLTRAATKALAQYVAAEAGLYSSRGAILEGTWDARPTTYNVAWQKNAALTAYGVSNSAAPVVQSTLDIPSGLNILGTDRMPYVPTALACAVRVGCHTTGHGATATIKAGHRDAVLEFYTGTYRTSTSMASTQLTVKVTVDGNVAYNATHDGYLTRVRVPLHRADSVQVDVTNADGGIYYLMLSQLTLREAGAGASITNPNLKIVTLMDSWGARYQSAFAGYLAAKSGATIVDHSLGGMTTVWALDWFSTYVLPEKPDVCVMDFQINDANQLSSNTYTAPDGSTKPLWPSGLTAAQAKALWRQNIQQLAYLCRANGIQPLFIVQSGTASESQTSVLCEWAAYIDQPVPAYPISSTEAGDAAAYVNTVGKTTGKVVTVGSSIKMASGPNASDAWANNAEDALVPMQKKTLSRAAYLYPNSVVIGTDSNADGLSDGFITQSYGTLTGDTYTPSIVSGNQRYAIAYAASGASGNQRVGFNFTPAAGKEYLIIFDVINATASVNLADSVTNLTGSSQTLGTNGSVTIDGTGAGVLCYRGTADAATSKYATIAPSRSNGNTRTFDIRKAIVVDLALLFADAPNVKSMSVTQLAAFVLALQP